MHIIDEKSSTLKDTSYDEDNKVYMVDSSLEVCSFDDVKEWYVKNKIPLANPILNLMMHCFLIKGRAFLLNLRMERLIMR